MRLVKILLISLTLIGLTACSSPSFLNPAPTVDYVATQVGLALTAFPTDTPVPTAVQPTVAPTQLPTQAVQNTATSIPPTAQPTSTPSPSDPAQSLGTPAWQDSFSNGKNWGLDSAGYSDDYTSIKVENDSLVMTSLTATGWQGWRLGGKQAGDAYLEATIHTNTCASNDSYGIIVRSPDYTSGHGYYFEITCAGQYALSVWDSTSARKLFNFSASPAINSGANQTNRFGIWMKNNQFKLYANGILLAEQTDDSISSAGHFGFFVTGINTAGFNYAVDEVSLWNNQ